MTHLIGLDPATHRAVRVDIEGDLIAQVSPVDEPAECWLSPGLVDLQVNGYHGFDMNADDVDSSTVVGMVRRLREVGVTTVVPTLVTAPERKLLRSLAVIARARTQHADVGHAIPFVHVEGPFLSPEDGPRGVHDLKSIRPPDIDEVYRWQRISNGLVGMLTLSPHWPSVSAFIPQVTAIGIAVAIGHTHANSEQIHSAADSGATLSTHLGNGAHAFLPRHPNYIWAQLADSRLRASLIADGHHLPADTFTAMLRAMGLDRVHLVSDATSLAGLAPGRYTTSVGTTVDLTTTGRLESVGTPYLAGGASNLNQGVATAMRLSGITLPEALELATRNPAQQLGALARPRGVLRAGAVADLITFDFSPGDDALQIRQVVAAGVVQTVQPH